MAQEKKKKILASTVYIVGRLGLDVENELGYSQALANALPGMNQ